MSHRYTVNSSITVSTDGPTGSPTPTASMIEEDLVFLSIPPWYLPVHHMSAYWDWIDEMPFPRETFDDLQIVLKLASETLHAYATRGLASTSDAAGNAVSITSTCRKISMLNALLSRPMDEVESQADSWLHLKDPLHNLWFKKENTYKPLDENNIWTPLPLEEKSVPVDEESWFAAGFGNLSCVSSDQETDEESIYYTCNEFNGQSNDESAAENSSALDSDQSDDCDESSEAWSENSWSYISDVESPGYDGAPSYQQFD